MNRATPPSVSVGSGAVDGALSPIIFNYTPRLVTSRCGVQNASPSLKRPRYPKQYNTPSCDPITTLPSAIDGDAESGAPVSNSQSFSPVSRSST